MREIETERLLLRKVRREDAADIYAHYANDPEVTKYMTWNVHESIDTTNAVMDFWLGDYDKPECYRWGIVRRADQEFMGMIDVVGYHEGIPVIGYCSGRAYWGNGYMTEALNAVLKQLKEDACDSESRRHTDRQSRRNLAAEEPSDIYDQFLSD